MTLIASLDSEALPKRSQLLNEKKVIMGDFAMKIPIENAGEEANEGIASP